MERVDVGVKLCCAGVISGDLIVSVVQVQLKGKNRYLTMFLGRCECY